MDIYDYQVKQIFKEAGIPVPAGRIAYTPREAKEAAGDIGGENWVVKAQMCGVYETLKDKKDAARWVAAAKSELEVFDIADRMLKDVFETKVGPQKVKKAYVEEALDIAYKMRFSIQIKFSEQAIFFVVAGSDGQLEFFPIPNKGMTRTFVKKCLAKVKMEKTHRDKVASVVQNLYKVFLDYDLAAAEINPLAVTKNGRIFALEGRMVFDPNALFKAPHVAKIKEVEIGQERAAMAKQNNFKYLGLKGNIACLVNGTGLGLATLDLMRVFRGEAACLLDIGTEPTKSLVTKAMKLILSEPNIEGVLVNIFGGATRCDVIAAGLIAAAKEISIGMPIVVRMDGTNAKIGERILVESGLPFVIMHTMEEAVARAISEVEKLP